MKEWKDDGEVVFHCFLLFLFFVFMQTLCIFCESLSDFLSEIHYCIFLSCLLSECVLFSVQRKLGLDPEQPEHSPKGFYIPWFVTIHHHVSSKAR